MEHEALPGFPFEALDLLSVLGGAKRAGDERLGFAAREDRGAVGTRQNAGLDPDGPNLVERAAVEPHAAFEHLVPQNLLLQILEDLLRFQLALDFAFGNRSDELVEDLVDPVVVSSLPRIRIASVSGTRTFSSTSR